MNSYFPTPILLTIFNRPEETQQVFNQIRLIKPKFLFIAADGPRPGRSTDTELCAETRRIVEQIDWDCELKTLFRDSNLGCGFAVCSAISWFFEQVEAGIVLEDDCLPEISFFSFCSELLIKYKNDETVFLISGTNMQNGIKRGEASYYFSNYPITWGWASWRRAWSHFVYDIPDMNAMLKSGVLDQVFQYRGEKSFWSRKLMRVMTEKKNIWDYQWWLAIWKNKGLTITPNINVIMNLGFRKCGSHAFLTDRTREPQISEPIQFPLIHPSDKTVNVVADRFMYKNAFSHSIPRFYRLVKENGIISISKYIITKLKR